MPFDSVSASVAGKRRRDSATKQTLANQAVLTVAISFIADTLKLTSDFTIRARLATSLAQLCKAHDITVHRVKLLRGEAWPGTAPAPPLSKAKPRQFITLAPTMIDVASDVAAGVSGEPLTVGAVSGGGGAQGGGAVQVTPARFQPQSPASEQTGVTPETPDNPEAPVVPE